MELQLEEFEIDGDKYLRSRYLEKTYLLSHLLNGAEVCRSAELDKLISLASAHGWVTSVYCKI